MSSRPTFSSVSPRALRIGVPNWPDGVSDLEQQYLVGLWAKLNGLRYQEEPGCLEWLRGEQCTDPGGGKGSACRPNWAEHLTTWTRDRRPAVLVGQPRSRSRFEPLPDDEQAQLNALAEEGMTVRIRDIGCFGQRRAYVEVWAPGVEPRAVSDPIEPVKERMDALNWCLAWVGHNRWPDLVFQWWINAGWGHERMPVRGEGTENLTENLGSPDNPITVAELRSCMPSAWSEPDAPESYLPRQIWLMMFADCGFVTDLPGGLSAPTEPLTVYRGTTWGRRRDMSWTLDRNKALWFAQRMLSMQSLHSPAPGAPHIAHVFRAEIEPQAVLAYFDRRNEREVVVDPRQLPSLGRAAIVESTDKPLEGDPLEVRIVEPGLKPW
jgi:hypothetical protein